MTLRTLLSAGLTGVAAKASALPQVVVPQDSFGPLLLGVSLSVSVVLLVALVALWRSARSDRQRLDEIEDAYFELTSGDAPASEPVPVSEPAEPQSEAVEPADDEPEDDPVPMWTPMVNTDEELAWKAQYEAILQRPVAVRAETLYFDRPAMERMFDDREHRTALDDRSLYRFTPRPFEADRMTVDFCASPSVALEALARRGEAMDPVCDVVVTGDAPAGYRQAEPGEAVLRNGFWTVVKKPVVVFG